MRCFRLSGLAPILDAPTSAGLQEGCTTTMTAPITASPHRPEQGGCLELAPGLEPGSAVYKIGAVAEPRGTPWVTAVRSGISPQLTRAVLTRCIPSRTAPFGCRSGCRPPFAAVAVTAALRRARREPSKVATTRT